MIISEENITEVELKVNQDTIERISQNQYRGTMIHEAWDI